jgi:altronate dehydratase
VKTALVISDRDNVATALEALEEGRILALGGTTVTVSQFVPRGHKIAVRPIRSGEAVIKYGSPIGVATIDIAVGAHVHIHNVASSRGRGDLASQPPRDGARLAEPADEGQ